jgi:hypothetical protein
MKKGVNVTTPVIRSLKDLFDEPLPSGPLVVHLTELQWSKLGDRLPVSKRRIGKDAKGLFVLPDPFGGFLAFFACAAGSGAGVACLPEIINTGKGITFGSGCTCIRGKDPVDPPVVDAESCSLGFAANGKLVCFGSCGTGRTCNLVRKSGGAGGRVFIACECS